MHSDLFIIYITFIQIYTLIDTIIDSIIDTIIDTIKDSNIDSNISIDRASYRPSRFCLRLHY